MSLEYSEKVLWEKINFELNSDREKELLLLILRPVFLRISFSTMVLSGR